MHLTLTERLTAKKIMVNDEHVMLTECMSDYSVLHFVDGSVICVDQDYAREIEKAVTDAAIRARSTL